MATLLQLWPGEWLHCYSCGQDEWLHCYSCDQDEWLHSYSCGQDEWLHCYSCGQEGGYTATAVAKGVSVAPSFHQP